MDLKQLLADLDTLSVQGTADKDIIQLDFDSRKVVKGSLFAAIPGRRVDGHDYVGKSIEKGAVAIVLEKMPEEADQNVTYILVKDSAEALGKIANQFFDRPSEKLKLVGITGTNGKTTTATLLYNLFQELGYRTGLLSTIENKIGEQSVPAAYTTPDAVGLQALLSDMVEAGCDYAFMEVSSHAIDQRRIAGLTFTGGIFTNITHDHLDYHKTFRAYIEAKKRFFDDLPKGAFALTNIDDRRGEVMVQNSRAKIHTYSLRQMAGFRAKIIDNSLTGLHLELDGEDFYARLIGEFNAYNLLAVYCAAILLDQEKWEVLTALSKLKAAEGRFDYVLDAQKEITGIVDYAHTPDALEKVLSTINKLKKGDSRIITIVGCGGDRDQTKRPIMAKVACDYSQEVIFTSDNPRSEDPDAIIKDMEKGIPPYATLRVLSITDRKQAIRTACRLAKAGDIILVAGKGHEKYQEINGVKNPFDDKEVLRTELSA